MKIARKFERRGPLYVPRYDVDTPGKRYERYRRRQRPQAFSFSQWIEGSISGAGVNSSSVSITGVGGRSLLVAKSFIACSTGTTFISLTVTDNVGNTYIPTTHSTVQWLNSIGGFAIFIALSYLLVGPSGSSTVTSAYTLGGAASASFGQTQIMEFPYVGNAQYDLDATAQNTLRTGTTNPIAVPSITPANTGELLVAIFNIDQGGENGSNSPWTTPSGTTGGAYILSSSAGSTAASFNDTVSPDSFMSLIAAFAENDIVTEALQYQLS